MTTRKIGVAALLGALAIGATAVPASAQCVSPVLMCFSSDNYAYETAYNNATLMSSTGSILTVVGRINSFAPPLDFLNANMPAKEYTFVWTLQTIAPGTVQTIPGRVWDTDYASTSQLGTLSVYEDATPDSPPTASLLPNPPNAQVPATFADGTLILSATIPYFHVRVTASGSPLRYNGSFNATYNVNGGTWGYIFDPSTAANLTGTWCPYTQCTTALQPGYAALIFGKTDSPPVPTLRSTWGALKMLYR
jgi:hypothetical protein